MKVQDYRNLVTLLENSGVNHTLITIEDTRKILNQYGFNL